MCWSAGKTHAYAGQMSDVTAAVAEQLESLPNRLAHSLAVGQVAERVAWALPASHRRILIESAYLHDIGYSPTIVATGLHQLDGARWLSTRGYGAAVCSLVAHHSCAVAEAKARNLGHVLAREYPEDPALADCQALLTYCDMTTGPSGRACTLDERLSEIHRRYQPDDPPALAMTAAEPSLREAVAAANRMLNTDQPVSR